MQSFLTTIHQKTYVRWFVICLLCENDRHDESFWAKLLRQPRQLKNINFIFICSQRRLVQNSPDRFETISTLILPYGRPSLKNHPVLCGALTFVIVLKNNIHFHLYCQNAVMFSAYIYQLFIPCFSLSSFL